MVTGSQIRTFFQGQWHDGDIPVMNAADHGAWLGSNVFDGARWVDGVAPDLLKHCQRLNRSALALGLEPTHSPEEIHDIALQGLAAYAADVAVYVRPMYWAIDSGYRVLVPKDGSTGFCISLEALPMAPEEATLRLTTTQYHRPVLANNLCNAKAACTYPNNARMLREAQSKGYDEALVADALGNVAETGGANVFMARDGQVLTPIANGTFLSGITRARHISNLRAAGFNVTEAVLSFDDFRSADEVFMTGNLNKITSVSEFDGTHYQVGAIAHRARKLYWEWAHSA